MTATRSLYVSLSGGIDVQCWREDYARGTVEDSEPYGLQGLRDFGFDTSYRPPLLRRSTSRRLAETALPGLNLEGYLSDRRRRRSSEAVFCWSEQDGILVAGGRVWGEPPCVTGVIWLTDETRSATHAVARIALRHAAGVFANSGPQRAALIEQFKLSPERVAYIPFGIAVEKWVTSGQRQPGPPLVVTAGNDRHRQFTVCLEAVRMVQQKVPELRLEMLSKQDVNVPHEIGVRRIAADIGDMRDAYRRASVVVVATRPNLHCSGLTVVLEAMACGVPVVATATAGMKDYIEDGVTGFLVPAGQPQVIAEKVLAVLRDASLAHEVGLAAQSAVRTRNTSERMVSDLASFIQQVAY